MNGFFVEFLICSFIEYPEDEIVYFSARSCSIFQQLTTRCLLALL